MQRRCPEEPPLAQAAARRPPSRWPAGLALVVAVALDAFGRTHTSSYAMGLLGHHGVAVITRAANTRRRAWIFGPSSNSSCLCTRHEWNPH